MGAGVAGRQCAVGIGCPARGPGSTRRITTAADQPRRAGERLTYDSPAPSGLKELENFSLGIVSTFADRMKRTLSRPVPASELTAYVGHLSYVVSLSAYFMSDMFYLRCFALGGSACGILYHALQPKPLLLPVVWGSLFVAVNSFMIYRILQEEKPVQFQPHELDLYDSFFYGFGVKPRQFQRLVNVRVGLGWEWNGGSWWGSATRRGAARLGLTAVPPCRLVSGAMRSPATCSWGQAGRTSGRW